MASGKIPIPCSSMFLSRMIQSETVSVPGSNNYTFNINVELDGYTPLGTIGFAFTSPDLACTRCRINHSDPTIANVTVRNLTSSAINAYVRVYVLYQKTS